MHLNHGMNAFWGNVLFLASPLLKEGFPGGSVGKASAFYVGDPGSIPRLGSSLAEGIGYPLQYSCLEKFHEWRSLVGYSPWDRKESDTTEQFPWSLDYTVHGILHARILECVTGPFSR